MFRITYVYEDGERETHLVLAADAIAAIDAEQPERAAALAAIEIEEA